MKKVLFIAYLFPPILNSGTYRAIKFVKYLPQFGWEPIVLTVKDPPDRPLEPKLLNLIPPNINIFRVPLFSKILAQKLSFIFPFSDKKKVIEGLEWRVRSIFFLPDVHASWYFSAARKALQIHKEHKFDLIFATGYPWTSFLIGYHLSKKLKIPLVLDYRDPWTGNPLWKNFSKSNLKQLLQKRFSEKIEPRIIKQTSLVVTTTEPFAKVLSKTYNINKKIAVITNGFDPELYKIKSKKNQNKIHIVYTGIWKGKYGPEPLYITLKNMKNKYPEYYHKFKIICAGFRPGAAQKYGLTDIVQEIGPVSYHKSIEIMQSADILYLPIPEGRFSQECLPGKFFDYIGSFKPIIVHSPRNSYLLRIAKDFVFFVDKENMSGLEEFLINLAENPAMLKTIKIDEKFVSKFNVYNLTKKLANNFNILTNNQL